MANLTRADAVTFFAAMPSMRLQVETRRYPLASVNEAMSHLRSGDIQGAAVLVP